MSAVTTIQDCEDSVSAVDADDKVLVYRNWLGIMKGTLAATLEKDGQALTRTLNEDRTYQDASGKALKLPGRSLLLVRNVGIHMYTDAVTTSAGDPIPEGFLDALITSWGALHDLGGRWPCTEQPCGAASYIVKPKMHGPEEVAATVELFGRIEQALGMPKRTLKIGYYGRRAPDDRQPEAVHRRRGGSADLHQHGVSRPHRRRDPHEHGRRGP